jgi:IPT/TIG domain/Galactose oxidase, central domain/Kelch motif
MKRVQCIWPFVLIVIWMHLVGCSGGGNGGGLGPMPEPNPAPNVTSVSPNSVTAGAPDTTVTISGSGFVSSSVANLNGQTLKTTFVSGTQVSAVIPAGALASGAVNNITVTNPPPGGGTSAGSASFTVTNPNPSISQISPSSIPSGAAATLIVTGGNFVPTSKVTLDGQALQTSFVSSSKLQATVPASPAVLSGNHAVAVVNPAPGGGTSGTSTLAVHLTIKVFQASTLWFPGSTNDVWARVSGGATGTITWTIQEGSAGGTLAANDVFDSSLNVRKMTYIAPNPPGTYHVIATSDDDPTQKAQATITVSASAEVFKKTTGNSVVDHQFGFTATRLQDGRVLISGGGQAVAQLSTAETYDPATGMFAATGSLTTARVNHTATLLNSGKVLVCGGLDSSGNALSSCELYDPATGIFTASASMSGQRLNHTATLLSNGRVFIAGGDRLHQGRGTCEIYDPVANTFTPAADLTAPRFAHTATLLGSGKLLITGGFNPVIAADLSSAEIYDVAANMATATGSMSLSRRFHSAVLLSTGKVLVTPGQDIASADVLEIYDSAAGTFSQAQLHIGRNNGTVVTLSDGRVLLASGAFLGEAQVSAEVFNPTTQTTLFTDNAAVDHAFGRGVLLANGTVLILGSDFSPLHADIYSVGP